MREPCRWEVVEGLGRAETTNSLSFCLFMNKRVRLVSFVAWLQSRVLVRRAVDAADGDRRLLSFIHPPPMLRRAPVVATTKILCVSNMEELAVEVRGSYGAYYKVN